MMGFDDCADAAVDAAKRISPNANMHSALLMWPPNLKVNGSLEAKLYCCTSGKANSLGLVAGLNTVDDLYVSDEDED